MDVFSLLLSKALHAGSLRLTRVPVTNDFCLQVKVFGAWVGIMTMMEHDVKRALKEVA